MSFFLATKADLEPGIRRIESQVKLKYVADGWHFTPEPEIFYSALDIPEFGKAIRLVYDYGNRIIAPMSYFSGTQKYLVASIDSEIVVRAVPQRAGGILYMVDFDSNEHAFWLYLGGRFEDNILVGGSVAPSTFVLDVRKLCFKFDRMVMKGFVKIPDPDYYHDPWKVGPEAMELLRQGVMPVTDSYPLQLPEEMRHGTIEQSSIRTN